MKFTTKTVALFLGVSLCALGSFLLLKNLRSQRGDSTFNVGVATGYAPFVSINAQGAYEGFDIDVANALTQKMGKALVLKDLGSMASLFMALNQGDIDAIIWGLSITQDRLKQVAMIRYQGETVTSYPLLFWQKIPAGVASINDMKGMTVCVEPASSQDAVLSRYPFITKKQTEKVDDALFDIQYSKAEAALVEPAIAKKFKNKYPEIQILDVPLAPEDQVQGIGIVIKKENTTLINQVQQAVDQLINTNVIKEYEKKWELS
jgi:arginine transport system substrate-binding protein